VSETPGLMDRGSGDWWGVACDAHEVQLRMRDDGSGVPDRTCVTGVPVPPNVRFLEFTTLNTSNRHGRSVEPRS